MSELVMAQKNVIGTEQRLEQLENTMCGTSYTDGEQAILVHLRNSNGVTATLMDIGATWLSFCAPVQGKDRELLIRANDMDAYLEQEAYLGATVGRFANRIAKGQFSIDGREYQLPINNGENSLHGGELGFDKKRWTIIEQTHSSVTFFLHLHDGEQGYPGNMDVKVRYELTQDNALEIRYEATCDKDCPVNLTNHAYFNLSESSEDGIALKHHLKVEAEYYLPVSETLIPTGELKPVVGTSFDFQKEKEIARDFMSDSDQAIASGYDHCFVFSQKDCDAESIVATLTAPERDLKMHVKTTKPGMQCYTGNFLAGINGYDKSYKNNDGVALETQYFPDAPNQPQWKSRNPLLKAGATYQHKTVYQLEW
ncbi:galactose-1-epimerase [Vibrio agarivorans]|uniref:galactose-1-epimerase n=1 Tax=Vibrio agarivorans TaxID=153622 RepID=UPI003F513B4E